jgi:mRNA-degrading endonuclease RelE of RelBE toxin-antitoxin system
MKVVLSKKFIQEYKKLPETLRVKVDRQLRLLKKDIRHPSLQAKKMKKFAIWEARIDYHYRATFEIADDKITMRRVGTHAIYRNP